MECGYEDRANRLIEQWKSSLSFCPGISINDWGALRRLLIASFIEEEEETSIGWDVARGRWNLATRDPAGNIVMVRPSLTPERDQRQKEGAISRLMGLCRIVADVHAIKACA